MSSPDQIDAPEVALQKLISQFRNIVKQVSEEYGGLDTTDIPEQLLNIYEEWSIEFTNLNLGIEDGQYSSGSINIFSQKIQGFQEKSEYLLSHIQALKKGRLDKASDAIN